MAHIVVDMLKTINRQTVFHISKKEYDEAIKSIEEEIRIQKMFSYERGIAESKFNLANIYMYKNQIQKSIDLLKESTSIFEKINHSSGIYNSQITLMKIFFVNGNESEAEKILEHYKNSDFFCNDVKTLTEISEIYRQNTAYQKSLEINKIKLKNIKSSEDRAKTLMEIALDFEKLGDLKSCKKILREAQWATQNTKLKETIIKFLTKIQKI